MSALQKHGWYCTCNKGEYAVKFSHHKKFFETKVDEEGVCSYCGYYAVKNPDETRVTKRASYDSDACYVKAFGGEYNLQDLFEAAKKGRR